MSIQRTLKCAFPFPLLWRNGQRFPVRVKFRIYVETHSGPACGRMGRKMLVVLMMEGKLSTECLYSMDADDDMLAAMARELVEKGGVGDSADAVWEELRTKRTAHLSPTRLPDHAEVDTDHIWRSSRLAEDFEALRQIV